MTFKLPIRLFGTRLVREAQRRDSLAFALKVSSYRCSMFGQAVRRFTTSALRASHYAEGPGQNLPFSVENKWKLLGMMVVFFGSGFTFPFIVVRHQILKK